MDTLKSVGVDVPGELRALLLLDQAEGIGPRRMAALVEAFGSAEAALRASRRAFESVAGVPRGLAEAVETQRRVDGALRQARRLGIVACTWNDVAYPERLRALHDPPAVLFLRGRAELLGAAGVAVVGARRATARGREVAARIGAAVAARGVTLVSGLALGIDGAAHRGALDAAGPTVAVVGRGPDRAYPAAHARLFQRILERGLVVSEFLPGTPPLPHHFPRRNRIMAALADAVVVVEAGVPSGALVTVEHALDLGREVWAVPGPIDAPSCAGSNGLLAEGARPLVSIERFVRETCAGPMPADGPADRSESPPSSRPGASRPPTGPDASTASVAGPERRLLDGLRDGPVHVDVLAARARLAVPIALAVLVELELRGAVEQLPGMFFRSAA